METENQFQNGRELHKAERLINKLNAFFFFEYVRVYIRWLIVIIESIRFY